MGYFSNGTESLMYEEEYCAKCAHQDGPGGDSGCDVWLAHLMHNYEECNNDQSILDLLIPRTKGGVGNEKCRMFWPLPRESEMKLLKPEERCRERVYDGFAHSYQCSRRGSVNRGGNLYCKQHDPVRLAERKAARQAKRDADWEARERRDAERQARRKYELACTAAFEGSGLEAGDIPEGLVKDLREKLFKLSSWGECFVKKTPISAETLWREFPKALEEAQALLSEISSKEKGS